MYQWSFHLKWPAAKRVGLTAFITVRRITGYLQFRDVFTKITEYFYKCYYTIFYKKSNYICLSTEYKAYHYYVQKWFCSTDNVNISMLTDETILFEIPQHTIAA